MAKASSKPTGVSISRKGSKFTITWTKGEKYTNQELVWSYTTEVRQNNSSSIGMYVQKPIKLNGSVKSRVLTITAEGLRDVNVGVRGKASGKKWSSYGNATISLKAAQKPTLEAVWEGTTPNRTKFNWSAEDAQKAPCSKVVYESILVKNCPEDYKVDDLFIGADRNEIAVSGKTEDTIIVDESGLTGSNARIVRMKAVGQTGESAWVYAYHVYAQPYAAKNVVANINYNPRIGYLEGSVSWDQQQNEMQHPIDTMALQYWIGIPSTNMGLPTTGDWETIDTPVDVEHDTWNGSFGRALVNDECLFMRVMTQHDNVSNSAYSDYVIALKANLATPTIDSVTPSLVSGAQLITVRLTDASQVPDSKVAVMYQNPDDNKIGVYGVTTNGQVSFYVKNTDTIGKVGAYAFVGTYTDNHNNLIWGGYSVDAVMKSPEVWQGVAQSPTITVTKFDDTTATVKWNWPWRDATNAEISWSDHADAWESTDQPNTYIVSNMNAAQWNISDLDEGKMWFFKVRLFYGDGDDVIYGTYSNMESLDLSAAPAIPVLTLSDQILTQDGEAIAAWTYVSNDTTPQNFAQLYRWSVDDDEYVPIENANTKTAQSLTLKASQIGEVGSKTDLVVKVWSESGHESEFSNPVTVTIATPVTCAISSHNLVSETISIDPQTRTGSLITLNGGDETNVRDVTSLSVALEPVQDNKYDSVWTGGNGKNLLLPRNSTVSSAGVTFTASNGIYTATGTATAAYPQWLLYNGTLELPVGSTYTLSANASNVPSGAYAYAILYERDTATGNNLASRSTRKVSSVTFTIEHPYQALVIVVEGNGVTHNNTILAPQLEKGSTATTWEPYSNIVPITAPTTSKNLLDDSVRFLSGSEIYFGTDTRRGKSVHLTAGTYTFSVSTADGTTTNVYGLDLGTNEALFPAGYNTYAKTFTIDHECDATLWCYKAGYSSVDDIVYAQLEKGSTATPYRPYGENISLTHTGDNLIDDTLRNYSNIVTLPEGTWYAQAFIYDTSEINTRLDYINENGVWTSIVNSPMETPTFSTEGAYTFGWGYRAGENPKTLTLHVTKPTTFRFTTTTLNNTRRLSLSRTKKNSLSEFVEYQRSETRYLETLQPNLYDPANLQIGKAWNGNADSARAIVWMPCSPNQEFTVTVEGGSFEQIYWFEKVSEDATSFVRNYAPPSYPYHVTTTATSQVMGIQFNKTAISASDFNGVKIRVVAGAFDGAIYGGNAELVGGTGKSTWTKPTIPTTGWVKVNGQNHGFYHTGFARPSQTYPPSTKYINSMYPTFTNSAALWGSQSGTAMWDSGTLLVNDARFTTVEDFQAALSATPFEACYELATPTDLTFTPQSITLNEGTNNVWSENGDVTIRTVEGYEDVLALKELPLEVTVTGTGNGVMRVERAQNFDLERPDERNFTGYEGEIIVQKIRGNVSDQIIVNRNELVGRFDDTARYRIIANVSDNFGQSATDTLEFIVDWTHQAVTAQGTVQIIDGVAYITPIKPDGALPTDRVDIYRLSADRPELIYEGVEYDETTGTYETIVDPYPTIGDFGGYRLVLVTANGDYICGGADEDNYPSWVGAEFEGSLDTYVTIIDFGDDEVVLEGNLQVSNSFEKSFERVKYLGGTSRGYWLSGAQRSGSGSTALVTLTDMDTIKAMRRLAQYTGMCHIRTPEGSNFHADIQVEDDISYQVAGKIMDCSLKITGIDPVNTDGVRLEDWEVE